MRDKQLLQNDSSNSKENPNSGKPDDIDAKKVLNKKSFIEKWEHSPYWFISGSYKVLHSIWMVVMAVGMFLAWLIALLAT
ncbi:hypothetical protein [Nonlabens ulvanivorans]|uniref:hypothetical protein n=1 Tax=Nonlabens ulvanivorans TaxID=906888 RepID=UPI002942ABF2|nr:hypothetical protein [Nonlabens ulvanivorans]WOI23399.1 hypothetical protein R1T42_02880 [Nonlabens ulvanivorans]